MDRQNRKIKIALPTKAPDAAIQANVVEVGFSCNDVSLILLCPVLQRKKIFLAIFSIVIKVHLAIHAVHWKVKSKNKSTMKQYR